MIRLAQSPIPSSAAFRWKSVLVLTTAVLCYVFYADLSGLALAQTPAPKLEVLPTVTKVFTNRKSPVLVVVRNSTPGPLSNLQLSWYTDAVVTAEGNALKLDALAAHSEHAWMVQVSANATQEFVPGHVHFRLDYSNGTGAAKLTNGVLLASLEVQSGVLQDASQIADVRIESTLESLTEQTPGKVYIVLTNKINKQVTATIKPTWPYGLQSSEKDRNEFPVTLEPHQSVSVDIGVEAKDRVRPGKHLLVFDLMLAWNESGQQQVRHNFIARPVDVGVLGESQILTLIGAPSFLLLPGFLVLLTIKTLWSLQWLKVKGQPKDFPWEVKSADFAFAAITISILLTGAYILFRHNLFEGYGLKDIITVWFFSVFIVGVLGYFVVMGLYRRHWRRVTPTTGDDPIPFLEKLGRRGLGINLDSAKFKIKINENEEAFQEAFLLESRDDAGETIWVAPPIEIQWTDNATDEFKEAIREQLSLDPGDPSDLASVLKKGEDGGALAQLRVIWKDFDHLRRPAEYRTADFMRLIGRKRMVNEGDDL